MKVLIEMTEKIYFSWTAEVELTRAKYNRYLKNKLTRKEEQELCWEADADGEGNHEGTEQWISDIEILKK